MALFGAQHRAHCLAIAPMPFGKVVEEDAGGPSIPC